MSMHSIDAAAALEHLAERDAVMARINVGIH